MKYLVFDLKAIELIVRTRGFQSVEYAEGANLVKHCCGELQSEIVEDINIDHANDGVIFCGKKDDNTSKSPISKGTGYKIFCIDLTTCNLMSEKGNPSDFLTVLQKAFRAALKFWNFQPFSFSERIHGSKSIIFPFSITDKRRIVIERSNNIPRLEKRGIITPLLAYKYNAEEPPQGEETVDTSVLKKAGEQYVDRYFSLQNAFQKEKELKIAKGNNSFQQITSTELVGSKEFIYLDYEKQLNNLTKTQRYVVDYKPIDSPLRVDGAAGTGKTVSLILRAYRILQEYRKLDMPIQMAFFSHSETTKQRDIEMFRMYANSEIFLDKKSKQNIIFETLLNYCCDFTNMSKNAMIERDAGEAKTYQLFLIESVVESAINNGIIRTFSPVITPELREMFDASKTAPKVLYAMLQHEFSIQIKGRTNGSIESYYDLKAIKNGLPCKTKKDKELIFCLYSNYQKELNTMASFDVDDVSLEALSRLNAPIWRRERARSGFQYIFVDEMHLFNLNEQSIFHYLTRDLSQKSIPICFALDYSQAIGDRGNVNLDYVEKAFGTNVERKNYKTVFRNSPQIAEFCSAIASSGTLMFQESFLNPYLKTQSSFTGDDEAKCKKPTLYMYSNDEEMIKSINQHITSIKKDLQCQPSDIAVIAFNDIVNEEGVKKLNALTGKQFTLINNSNNKKSYLLTSPYDINGLEFDAVILCGVDEGRVPQTCGVSDISQHFMKYSAFNMLYLSASRAKYRLIILGSRLKGRSSCLEYSINNNNIFVEEVK